MRNVWYVYLAVVLVMTPVQAIVIGSQTVASRQAQVNFPVSDGDNEMRGFAAFEQGFTFENQLTSCIFSSVFPVGGTAQLLGGTLSLQKNLVLEGNSVFDTLGTVNCNSRSMRFTKGTAFGLPVKNMPLTTLNFVASQSTVATINSIDWSHDGAYVAIGINTGAGDELRVYSFNGTTLTQVATASTLSASIRYHVYSVRWHPSAYYISVSIQSDPNDDDTFVYSFNSSNNTLAKVGTDILTGNGAAVGWHPSGNWLVTSSDNPAGELKLYSVSNGVITNLQIFDMNPNRTIQINALSWNAAGTYFAVGSAQAATAAELSVFSFNGSNAVSIAVEAEIGQTVSAVAWNPTGPYIAVGLAGGSERLRVYQHTAPSTLTEQTTARVGEVKTVESLDWHPDGTKLLVGLQSGTGTEFRVYYFDATTLTLSLMYSLELANTVNCVRWSKNGLYVARADNTTHTLSIYSVGTQTDLIINNGKLIFEADAALNRPVRFQGTCEVYGNGRNLDCSAGSIILDAGASVLFDTINLKGISDGKLMCLDTLGTVSLRSVTWQFDNSYSFTQGKLAITGDVTMTGTQIFSYTSSQTCTISSGATWQFGPGMTLRYAPSSGNSLLQMVSGTSQLYFNEATLSVSTAGLQLTKGKVKVEGSCPLISDATSQAQGIYFGDGVSSSNDVTVQFVAQSGFVLQSGFCTSLNLLG